MYRWLRSCICFCVFRITLGRLVFVMPVLCTSFTRQLPVRCAFLLDLFQLGLCVDQHLGMCDRVKIIISVLQFTASVYGIVHALVPMWLLPFPSTFWLVYNFVLFYGIQCFSLCFLEFRELDFYYLNFEKKTETIVTRFFVACFFC